MTAHILISSSGCPSRLRPSSFLQKRSIGAVSRSKEKHRDQCEIATGMNLHNASRRTLLDDESKGAHTFQRLDRHFAPFPMRSQEGCELQQDLLGSLVCWSERAFDRDETPLSLPFSWCWCRHLSLLINWQSRRLLCRGRVCRIANRCCNFPSGNAGRGRWEEDRGLVLVVMLDIIKF